MATTVISDLQGPQLPHRTALGDLVDPVHRPAERADVARRRPERAHETHDEQQPGALVVRDRAQGGLDGAEHVGGDQRVEHLDDRVDRLLGLAHHAEQRDQRDRGREDRQHRVVGQRGRDVGALVVDELAPGLAQHVEPRPLGQLGGAVGLARVVGVGDRPLLAVGALRRVDAHGPVAATRRTPPRATTAAAAPASTSGRGEPESVVARSLRSATLAWACDFTSSLAASASTVPASWARWASISASSC